METFWTGLIVIGGTLLGILIYIYFGVRKMERQQLRRLIDELDQLPRLRAQLDHNTLTLTPYNAAGLVAARVICLWIGMERSPSVTVGDTISLTLNYPLSHDSYQARVEGASGSDRGNPERARSPFQGT